MASPVPKGSGARAGQPSLLARIRKDLARPRHEPLRIMIAGDARRPVRAIVLPRLVPLLAALSVGVLALVASGLMFTSVRLGASVDYLRGRVASMVAAAETVARHPLPAAVLPGVGLSASGSVAPADSPRLHAPTGTKGRFRVESVNTAEEVEVVIDLASGEPEAQSYRQLRHLLRCLRTGAETPTDPRLVELLFRIAQRTRQKILLVSGFRAPMFSLADLSYHTRGMAADIRVPGMTPLMLRDLVQAMGVKGVGYYPTSQFVHVDVREERHHWTDYGANRQDSEGSEHGPDQAAASSDP